ncbi:MAG: protease inhibitor I42 family protein [Candidatus Riflebacteria bacterium]|nr:protease inhibitor I42 family protein [Candidatus Riflebacteria bacterium]
MLSRKGFFLGLVFGVVYNCFPLMAQDQPIVDGPKDHAISAPTKTKLEPIVVVEGSVPDQVTLQMGQRLIVKLEANPSTGFSWFFGKFNRTILMPITNCPPFPPRKLKNASETIDAISKILRGEIGSESVTVEDTAVEASPWETKIEAPVIASSEEEIKVGTPESGEPQMVTRMQPIHIVGAPVQESFVFVAHKRGETDLNMAYYQGWEKDVEPARKFSLRVVVKAPRFRKGLKEKQ